MKLEAGKSYYRRDGGVESIVRVGSVFAINSASEQWYLDGKGAPLRPIDVDLISEVPSADQAFSETAEAGLSDSAGCMARLVSLLKLWTTLYTTTNPQRKPHVSNTWQQCATYKKS